MYQDVQGSPRAGIPPLARGWSPIRSIERAFATLHHAFEAWKEKQAAIHELQKLDDHLLLDLGIERREIPGIVARRAAANRGYSARPTGRTFPL